MLRMVSGDEGLERALGCYLKKIREEETVSFLLCKSVKIDIEKQEEDRWKLHGEGLKELKYLKERNIHPSELERLQGQGRYGFSLLDLKIELAERNVKSCSLCERKCRIDRKHGERGLCGVGYKSRVASAFPHIGEEPELVPSGTIFFSGCNSRCVFCQNWDISQFPGMGDIWPPERIANWIMDNFTSGRIINANFVGGEPTPNTHNILKALKLLSINVPIVWNSNMYMSEECIKLLDGVVDVYLSDFKYGNDECALRLSSLPNYFRIISRNHMLAGKQADLLIRHLVMPNHIECDSKPILDWITENLDNNVRVNIMSQYRPEYKALEYSDINRRLNREEYFSVLEHARKIGLWNIETQKI